MSMILNYRRAYSYINVIYSEHIKLPYFLSFSSHTMQSRFAFNSVHSELTMPEQVCFYDYWLLNLVNSGGTISFANLTVNV